MSLWDNPVSDTPMFTDEESAKMKAAFEAMPPEYWEGLRKKIDETKAKLRGKWGPHQYRCCPHGCCSCRRY